MKKYGSLLVITAGIFWGSMGLFVRTLGDYGFTSVQIVALRLTVAAIVFRVILAIKEPSGFRIQVKDIKLFLGLGLGSVMFFTICYFMAIRMMSMSTAAILLYTSPIWVMLMSIAFLGEKMNKVKLIALILAFAGCVLVSGIGGGSVNFFGIIVGICSGIGYGLYSILGTIALRRYSTYVVTTYTFIIAAIGTVLVCNPIELVQKAVDFSNIGFLIFFVILTGIVTAVVPFLTYTLGLQYMEASKAAILATIEPMVATLLGAVVYHEPITLMSGMGVLCILGAVVVLNVRKGK